MRLSEIYSSVQGEGPNVGKPTVFVRFAGCNMRCPGWPCDTPYAIFPETYRNEWTQKSVENVIDDIKRQGPRNVCFTGGEPFLQPAAQLYQVMTVLGTDGYTFEFFTNGSILFPSWMRQRHDVYRIRTTIVQDWKLQGSGERDSFLDIRGANRDNLSTRDAIKFTVKDEEDLHEAARVWMSIGAMMDPPLIYVGKVWEATKISDADVVEFILDEKLPWRLNVQLHKHIWPADQRAI